jgi:hypothetical protein
MGGNMANLFGLSPEEISRIQNNRLAESATLGTVAKALADARNNAVGKQIITGKVGDVEYPVMLEDVPAFANYAAQNRTETFNLPDGNGGFASFKIPLAEQDNMIKVLAEKNKIDQLLPIEKEALNALTSQRNAAATASIASANRDRTLTPFDVALKTQQAHQAYETARNTGVEADIKSRTNTAIQALSGVTDPNKLFTENLGTAVQAAPSTIPALANKYKPEGTGPTIEEKRKLLKDAVAINPKSMTLGDVNAFNTLAEEANFNTMVLSDGKDSEYILLPIVNGVQMTPKLVREYATKNNMQINQVLELIKNQTSEE